MTELKLPRLPDRTPVRLTILITPELHGLLGAYAEAYQRAYGQSENVADMIPYILQAFLDGDRSFTKSRNFSPKGGRA